MIEMTRTLLMLATALTIAGPASAGTGAQADWGRLDSLATGDPIAGPAGWLNWCMGDRGRCAPADGPQPVRATAVLLDLLESVQARVNGALTPRAEPPGQDLWQLGAASGDCEDYALAKQAALRAAGLPAGAARLATARLPHGELHAVLAVETDRGTLVLDNLQRRVVPMNALNYAWLRAQGFDRTLRWRQLAGAGSPAPLRSATAAAREGMQAAGATRVGHQ